MDDAQRLQDLISSNALMAAILGEPGTSVSADTTDTDAAGTNTNDATTKGMEAPEIINSIASSHDLDALIDGIASDLEYFVQNLSSSSLPMLMHIQGPAIEGAVGVGGIRRSSSVDSSARNTSSRSSSRDSLHCLSEPASIPPRIVSDNTATANRGATTTEGLQPITLHLELLTLVCRIARIKDLLYNENISSPMNDNNSHNEAPTSFIQHFLPMISGNSNNDQQYYMDYDASSPSSSNYNANTENAKRVLQAMLKNTINQQIIIPTLLQYLHLLPFESRKNVSSIFNYLLVNSDYNVRMDFVSYVQKYFTCIMDFIVGGHFVNVGGNNDENNNRNQADDENDKPLNEKKLEKDLNNNINVNNKEASSSIPPPPSKKIPTATAVPMKTPDIALHCGSMLRSIIRHPVLYAKLVNDETNVQKYILPFLDSLVNQANFEVASDALETLCFILHPIDMDIVLPFDTDADDSPLSSSPQNNTFIMNTDDDGASILSSLKDAAEVEAFMEKLSSNFLERDYEPIFTQRFNPKLLSSDHANYITRRLSLQLLSSILLSRSNYTVMIQYVSSKANLRTIMMLLRDTSAHITLEAFNVFKIFVANPNKPPEVIRILADNKVKLIKYLTGLHKEKEEVDEQFRDEKILVITTLEQLN